MFLQNVVVLCGLVAVLRAQQPPQDWTVYVQEDVPAWIRVNREVPTTTTTASPAPPEEAQPEAQPGVHRDMDHHNRMYANMQRPEMDMGRHGHLPMDTDHRRFADFAGQNEIQPNFAPLPYQYEAPLEYRF